MRRTGDTLFPGPINSCITPARRVTREDYSGRKKNFFGWNAADFGWGADRVENILWRLENGELDNVNPKVIVLLAGTNNVGGRVPPEGIGSAAADVTKGLEAVVRVMQSKAPGAVIVVMGIFPRNDNMAVMPEIDRVNAHLSTMADGRNIRYLNINTGSPIRMENSTTGC
jgi:hypothetical protein